MRKRGVDDEENSVLLMSRNNAQVTLSGFSATRRHEPVRITAEAETLDANPLGGVRVRDRLLVKVYDKLPRLPTTRYPYMESML